MIDVKRIRHAAFATDRMDEQVDYYQSIIGLGVVAREAGRVFFATESQQLTLILESEAAPRCKAIAFEVAPSVDLSDLKNDLGRSGIKSEIRSGYLPGIEKSLVFDDVDGRRIELLSTCEFCPAVEPIRGLAVGKLGHIALFAPDPEVTARFYAEVLGFRVSDRIEANFVFMRCGFEHHTVNFARGSDARPHHLAFELRDASHLHQACDLLGRRRMSILWGPVRHGPGHNVAIYHRNPDVQLDELFFDMDRMVDEELGYFEPRPWHRDRPQRPKTWVGLPRVIWGQRPSPEATEFSPAVRGGT